MTEEAIRQALEIIKKPITVNFTEYKYFDLENYDKLIAVYDNCLWFINNFEQFKTTVERVQQENQQLKEQNEFLIKRENKLQQIEMMFKNRNVDLEELSNLILEGSNE